MTIAVLTPAEDEFAIPGQVGALITGRVGRLDEVTRTVLALTAVTGMEAPRAVVEGAASLSLAGLERGEIIAGSERAVEARILAEREDQYVFSHPLYHETIYRRLSSARREHLHGLVARTIEAIDPGNAGALAYHYERSGDRPKAIVYLEQSADQARASYANSLAEAQYRRLLVLVAPGEEDGAIGRVYAKLGMTLDVMARHDEALEALEEAAARFERSGRREELGEVVALIARAHAARGAQAEAIRRVAQTRESLGEGIGPLTRARLALALAHLCFATGEFGPALAAAEEASTLAEPLRGQREGLQVFGESEVRRASVLAIMGRTEEARPCLEEAIPLVEAAGDLATLARTYNNVSVAAMVEGDFARNRQYVERALSVAERLGDPARIAIYRSSLAHACYFTGKWQEALALAKQGYQELAELGPSWHSAYASYYLGLIESALGRLQDARVHLEESVRLAGEDLQARRVALCVLADLDLFVGRPEDALARLQPLDATSDDFDTSLTTGGLARAYAALGDRDRAIELAERTVDHVSAEYPIYRVGALRTHGMVLLELGEYDRAGSVMDEAIAIAERIGYGNRLAQLLLSRSRLERLQGRDDSADRLLGQGRDLLYRLGGDSAAARALAYRARELSEMGE